MKYLKIIIMTIIALISLSVVLLFNFSPLLNTPPQLTGNYAVGTITTSVKNGERDIAVTWYYPADTQKNVLYPSQSELWSAYKKYEQKNSYLPGVVWDLFFDGIKSYAASNALVKKERPYPVIIFSHGIGAFNTYSTYLEELASQGYIIAALMHPYDIPVSVLKDGTIIEMDKSFEYALKNNARDAIYEHRKKSHHAWANDCIAVLNSLEKYNSDASFVLNNAIDLENIGALGHSHGGWVITDVCMRDSRIKAGVNMDGYTKTVPLSEFNKPFLVLLNKDWINKEEVDAIYKNNGPDAIKIAIPGAGHNAFSDYILLKWPLVRVLGVATQNPLHVRTNIINHLLAFFNKSLHHKS